MRHLVLAAALAVAPFQCPSDPDPQNAREETPGEALYALAQKFRAAKDTKAEERTLRFIVERYPNSRFAAQAEDDLKKLGSAAASTSTP